MNILLKIKSQKYLDSINNVITENTVKKIGMSREVLSATNKIITKSYDSLTDAEITNFFKDVVLAIAYEDIQTEDIFLKVACKQIVNDLDSKEISKIYNL